MYAGTSCRRRILFCLICTRQCFPLRSLCTVSVWQQGSATLNILQYFSFMKVISSLFQWSHPATSDASVLNMYLCEFFMPVIWIFLGAIPQEVTPPPPPADRCPALGAGNVRASPLHQSCGISANTHSYSLHSLACLTQITVESLAGGSSCSSVGTVAASCITDLKVLPPRPSCPGLGCWARTNQECIQSSRESDNSFRCKNDSHILFSIRKTAWSVGSHDE